MLTEKILESKRPPSTGNIVLDAPNVGFFKLSSCLERSLSFRDFTLLRLKSKGQIFHTRALKSFEGGINGTLITCFEDDSTIFNSCLAPEETNAGDILISSTNEDLSFSGEFIANCLMITDERMARHGLSTNSATVERICGTSVSGKMLSRQVSGFLACSAGMSSNEAQALLSPTLALLQTVRTIAKQPGAPESSHVLTRIKAFIQENLNDPDLTVEMITDALAMSRATLYRAAEPVGGIQRFIREERLKRAYKCLSAKDGAASITTLTYDLGFGSENAFRRSFKERFGITPSEARRQAR